MTSKDIGHPGQDQHTPVIEQFISRIHYLKKNQEKSQSGLYEQITKTQSSV